MVKIRTSFLVLALALSVQSAQSQIYSAPVDGQVIGKDGAVVEYKDGKIVSVGSPIHPRIITQATPTIIPTAEDHLVDENLKPPKAKQYFIGGGGVKKLGQQLAFPVTHPRKFIDNCSHPVRHPLVAFKQFSTWVEPYNSGLSACSSMASIAGSAALQTLWTNKFKP